MINDLLNQEIDNCMKEGHSIDCAEAYLVWLGLKDVCIATAGERQIGLSYDVAGFDVESFRTYEDYLLLTVKKPKEKDYFSDVLLTIRDVHEKELDISTYSKTQCVVLIPPNVINMYIKYIEEHN